MSQNVFHQNARFRGWRESIKLNMLESQSLAVVAETKQHIQDLYNVIDDGYEIYTRESVPVSADHQLCQLEFLQRYFRVRY